MTYVAAQCEQRADGQYAGFRAERQKPFVDDGLHQIGRADCHTSYGGVERYLYVVECHLKYQRHSEEYAPPYHAAVAHLAFQPFRDGGFEHRHHARQYRRHHGYGPRFCRMARLDDDDIIASEPEPEGTNQGQPRRKPQQYHRHIESEQVEEDDTYVVCPSHVSHDDHLTQKIEWRRGRFLTYLVGRHTAEHGTLPAREVSGAVFLAVQLVGHCLRLLLVALYQRLATQYRRQVDACYGKHRRNHRHMNPNLFLHIFNFQFSIFNFQFSILHRRVFHPDMVDAHHLALQQCADAGNVAVGQRAVVELPLGDFAVNQLIYH